ncbi:UNVERIFIED_CONTAM: hypothetical protein FKN15_042725 [Acipenser sinensis]
MFSHRSNSPQQLRRTEGQWASSDPIIKPAASLKPGADVSKLPTFGGQRPAQITRLIGQFGPL